MIKWKQQATHSFYISDTDIMHIGVVAIDKSKAPRLWRLRYYKYRYGRLGVRPSTTCTMLRVSEIDNLNQLHRWSVRRLRVFATDLVLGAKNLGLKVRGEPYRLPYSKINNTTLTGTP